MNKMEALKELMNGKKLIHPDLEGEYIYINKKGQIVNDKGTVFNIQLAPDKGWSEYVEKVKNETVEVFNKEKALIELMNGKKIKSIEWKDDKYIYIDKNGQIVDNNGDLFNFMAEKEDKWTYFVEKKPDNSIDKTLFKELEAMKKMIEELSKKQVTTGQSNCIIKEDREEMEEFFYGATGSAVKEAFREELREAKDKSSLTRVIVKYIPYCWMGKKFNTAKKYYVDMRNIIKEELNESDYLDLALALFMIPSEVHEKSKQIDSKKVIEKINDRETFEPAKIKEIINMLKGYIEKIFEIGFNDTDNNLLEKYKENGIPVAKQQTPAQVRANIFAAYLAFVTGRRKVEILKTLEIIKENGKWFYKGLAKKKDYDYKIEAIACDDIEFIKKVLEQLRKDLDTTNLTEREVNNKYGAVFNRGLKRITGTNYTYHDLREIYAELCYLENGKDKGTEREELDYKAKILGHEIDNDRLLATEHYMTMKGN